MDLKRFASYLKADTPYKKEQLAWPLYGAGIENLGKNGKPVIVSTPEFTDDELLMRIDAVSLCYTDVKEIDAGETHPRLTGRDLKTNPIIPGHEISFTVVGVGKDLTDQYRVGDRYTLQPDVWVDGKSIPFCFDMDGGYRQYAKVGKEILKGDAGNYLIPIPDDMPYASSAITEPWACVEAAYRMQYRNTLKKSGSLLICGSHKSRSGYWIDEYWFGKNSPKKVIVCNIPADLKAQIVKLCESNSIILVEKGIESIVESGAKFDDVILLDSTAEEYSQAGQLLENFGVMALMAEEPLDGFVEIDMGRLHYDSTYFVGGSDLEISTAYQQTNPRVSLKPAGRTWILGAGGPMGRLHLQRAIESDDGPGLIVASEVTRSRYEALLDFFVPFAKKNKKDLLIVNPNVDQNEYQRVMENVKQAGGFDDIQIMVAIPDVIAESIQHAGVGAVIDLFAGLKRGVTSKVDAWLISGPQQVRFVGHSGSGLDDQKAVVERVISGQLKPQYSVAAIGGINQIADGIKAMKDWVFPGKIVIYPHVLDFPLISIAELDKRMPEIGKYLGEGKTWSFEAEKFFLEKNLIDYE